MTFAKPRRKNRIDEKKLTKGELRKLTALRKSIGDELAGEAFAKWYANQGVAVAADDPNIAAIEKALHPLIRKIRMPKGGAYAIRRGRGRFIVEPIEFKS
jgi:hypothetical protein